eukprot:1781094-Pyramimonas_sp.AAC.1
MRPIGVAAAAVRRVVANGPRARAAHFFPGCQRNLRLGSAGLGVTTRVACARSRKAIRSPRECGGNHVIQCRAHVRKE